MADKKQTVTAFFPGIGKVEITKERAAQIKRLQEMIRKHEYFPGKRNWEK